MFTPPPQAEMARYNAGMPWSLLREAIEAH
jgi:hypothetical protein